LLLLLLLLLSLSLSLLLLMGLLSRFLLQLLLAFVIKPL